MVRKVLAVTWLLCSMSAVASVDPVAVSNAEQWLQTALSSPQNGSDAARVLEVTSALSVLTGAGLAQCALSLKTYAEHALDRDGAIQAAFASGGYTIREIGSYFGLHYSRVSRILKARGKT